MIDFGSMELWANELPLLKEDYIKQRLPQVSRLRHFAVLQKTQKIYGKKSGKRV